MSGGKIKEWDIRQGRGRRARKKRTVPSRLNMTLNPLLHGSDIFCGILKIFANVVGLAAADEAGLRRSSGLVLDRPATVLDASRKVVRTAVGLGILQIEILCCGGRVICVEATDVVHINQGPTEFWEGRGYSQVRGSHLSSIGVHAARGLARLDIAPYHRSHVTLIVHEASIEVWCVVRVRRHDVGLAAGEGVFQEMEHAEEFALRHEHVIAEETDMILAILIQ